MIKNLREKGGGKGNVKLKIQDKKNIKVRDEIKPF